MKKYDYFFLAVSMSRCPDVKFVKYLREARSSEKSGGRRGKIGPFVLECLEKAMISPTTILAPWDEVLFRYSPLP